MNYLLIAAIIAFTGCLPSAAVVSQARVHPAFAGLSAEQVRQEFTDYEEKGKQCAQDQARGKRCAPISFAPERPLNLPIQGASGIELLTFRVSISTPRSQVRELGFRFGQVARQRTPEDRADVFGRLVARMRENPKTLVFVFRLIAEPESGTQLPQFGFALINQKREKIWSSSQTDFTCSEPDLICRAVLQQSGQPVTFPLFVPPNGAPFVDDIMRTVRLIVFVDDHEEAIDFDLNSLQ